MDTFIFHNLFFNLNGLVGGSSLFHIYIVNSVQCDSIHKGGTNFFAKEEPYEQALIEVQSHFDLSDMIWNTTYKTISRSNGLFKNTYTLSYIIAIY